MVGEGVELGEGVEVGEGVELGEGVKLGEGVELGDEAIPTVVEAGKGVVEHCCSMMELRLSLFLSSADFWVISGYSATWQWSFSLSVMPKASGGTLFPINLLVQLVFLAKQWSICADFLLEASMNSVPVIRNLF